MATGASPPGPPSPVLAYPPATHADVAATLPHKTGQSFPWIVAGSLVALVVATLTTLSFLLRPGPPHCPHGCRRPPPLSYPPLPPPRTYTSPTYGYSLAYNPAYSPVGKDDRSIAFSLTYDGGDVGAYIVSAELANGRTAAEVAQDVLQRSQFPDARLRWPIPGAEIGYQPGAGNLYYEPNITPNTGQAVQGNIIVMAAIKRDDQGRDVAVTLFALGTKDFTALNLGHPNPAGMYVGRDVDAVINTVTWKGEKPL